VARRDLETHGEDRKADVGWRMLEPERPILDFDRDAGEHVAEMG
jgi:hypothetical protein